MADDTTDAVAGVDELMQRIAHDYEALPRQLKSIATHIEQHRASVMMDRTSDIAASCEAGAKIRDRATARVVVSAENERQC